MRFGIAAALVATSLLLASCYHQNPYVNTSAGIFANSYGSGDPMDCKVAVSNYGAENVWWGRVSGSYTDPISDSFRRVSRWACFPNQTQCEFWRANISSPLIMTRQNSCVLGYNA